MKDSTFAIYKGIEYSAGIKDDGNIVLRSHNLDDINRGFHKKVVGNNSIYIKYVSRDEIEKIYDKRVVVRYKGFEFNVIEETEDKISIVAMTGDYHNWLNLEMTCIDKGIYQKWIDKCEAEMKVIIEEL